MPTSCGSELYLRLELVAHAAPGLDQLGRRAGVVSALLDVPRERLGVGSGAESPPGAGHDDRPDAGVAIASASRDSARTRR